MWPALAVLAFAWIVSKMADDKENAPVPPPTSPSDPYLEPAYTREEFRQRFTIEAVRVDWRGINWKAALAMASVESGDGTGGVFRHTRNLFSITKGSKWGGPVYKTKDGRLFRIYPSWKASMDDWVRLMHIPLYGPALAHALAGNTHDFFREVKRIGYDASEPKYAQILIDRFNALA